jgi:hypothetical protein
LESLLTTPKGAPSRSSRTAPARSPERFRWAWLLPLVPAVAFYAAFIARSSFSYRGRSYFELFDDAMISMRYGQNLTEGHGLTWSFGHHVEGYSNFLWTLVMAVVHLLPISTAKTSLAMMVIGAALLVATALLARRIAQLLVPGNRLAPLLALGLVALYYPLVFWSLRGMEVGLAALLVSAMVLLALEQGGLEPRRSVWWLAAVMAAAVLTRDDLIVPSVVALGYLAWALPAERRRAVLLPVAGTLIATLLAHTAFRLAYYDSALPNTYYLKLSKIGLGTRLDRGALALGYTVLRDIWAPLLLAGTLFALRRRTVPRGAWLLAAVFLAQCAYSVYAGGDAWEDVRFPNRYISTVAPLMLTLSALGTAELFTRDRRRAPWVLAGLFVALAPLIAWQGFPTLKLGITEGAGLSLGRFALGVAFATAVAAGGLMLARARPDRLTTAGTVAAAMLALLLLFQIDGPAVRDWERSNYQGRSFDVGWMKAGLALRQVTAPGTSIAVVAAGNIIYFSDRPGVDLLGKMDPVVAKGPPQSVQSRPGRDKWKFEFRPGHNKWNYRHSVGHLRPAVVAGLLNPTRRDLCDMGRWGYRQVGPSLYIRSGVPGIRRRAAVRAMKAIDLPSLPRPRNCSTGS